ncbi:MAG: YfhO family protein [Clostridia bacterium]|nr:YfhO family protein [Clostridia bacterium]
MSQTRTVRSPESRTGIRSLVYENRFCLLAFFCATILMLLVFYCFDMLPIFGSDGDVTILRMDLYHQYGPLFAELYERVKHGRSLLYSWNTGMGGSFLGNFYNYLASPLLVTIFLFKHVDLPDAIALMVLLKAAFAAAFFTYYLRRSHGRSDHITAAFGVLYAFCGFFIAYYWNVMWIDAMALFPLVILGIERIIENRKFLLYTVTLTVIMISNYYMAMMVCIFSVLYFLVRFFSVYAITAKYDEKSRRFSLRNSRFLMGGATFAFASVASALLALFALLPTVFILRTCSATSGTFPSDFKMYYDVFDFLANHLASVDPTIRSSGTDVLPNVYCGVLTVMLIPLYLLSKTIKLREKVAYVLLLAVLYFSFNVNFANYVWHGFHFPNDLPYRFSFMYSFILLTMAFRAIVRIREFSGRELLLVGIGMMAFIVLVQKIGSKNVTDNTVLISLAFAFLYTLTLAALRNPRLRASSVALLLLCCVVSEAAIADTDNYSMNQTKGNYSGDYEDFKGVKSMLDRLYGGQMYRMELADLRTRMDPAWYDYNGLSTFSSMASEKLSNLQSHLGMYGNYINSYTYHPQTPVYNAMTALQYVVKKSDSKDLANEELYTFEVANDRFKAYENRWCLPVAFCVSDLVERWNDTDSNPFTVQSDFWRRAAFADGVFNQMTVTDVYCDNISEITEEDVLSGYISFNKIQAGAYGSFTVTIAPTETQNCYLYVKSSAVDTVYVTGDDINMTQSIDEAYILDLGVLEKGEEVEVEIPLKDDCDSGSATFHICGLDMDVFTEGFETLKRGALQISDFTETHIEGTLHAEQGQILYTSIPYDDGWKITVDGKRVPREDYLRIADALLGVRIDAGEHKIVMDYEPIGLRFGATVSVLTLVVLALGMLLVRRRRKAVFTVRTPQVEYIEEFPLYVPFAPYEEAQAQDAFGFIWNEEIAGQEAFPQDEGFTVSESPIGSDEDGEQEPQA